MVAYIAKQWTRKLEVYRTVAMFEFYLSSSCLDWGSDLFLWAERNMQNGGTCLRSFVAQNRRRGREFTRDKPRLQTIEWMTFVRAWQKVSKEKKKNSKRGLKIFLSHLSLKLGLMLLFFFKLFVCTVCNSSGSYQTSYIVLCSGKLLSTKYSHCTLSDVLKGHYHDLKFEN